TPVDKPVQAHPPTTDPKIVRRIKPPVVPVTGTETGTPIVDPPPSCPISRPCPPPKPSCSGSRFLCSVPRISVIWHLPKHLPVLVLAMVFCVAFPSALFDSTLEANYEQVTRWFRGSVPAGAARRVSRRLPAWAKLGLFVGAAATAFTLAEKN